MHHTTPHHTTPHHTTPYHTDLLSRQSISTEGIELMIEVPSFEYTPLRVAL